MYGVCEVRVLCTSIRYFMSGNLGGVSQYRRPSAIACTDSIARSEQVARNCTQIRIGALGVDPRNCPGNPHQRDLSQVLGGISVRAVSEECMKRRADRREQCFDAARITPGSSN